MHKVGTVITIIIGFLFFIYLACVGYVGVKLIGIATGSIEKEYDWDEYISNDMKGRTRESINWAVESIEESKSLSAEEIDQLKLRLTKECDIFEKDGISDLETYKSNILLTLNKLKPLITHKKVIDGITQFYRIAKIEFDNFEDLDTADQTIKIWIEENLTFDQKLDLIKNKVTETALIEETEQEEDESNIEFTKKKSKYTSTAEKLLSDIEFIREDKSIKKEDFTNLVNASLNKFSLDSVKLDNGYNFTLVYLIPDTYHKVAKLLGYDVTKELLEWYNKEAVYPIPTLSELRENSLDYLEVMRDAELINMLDKKKLEYIIQTDIDKFKITNDTLLLKTLGVSSLQKIEEIAGDTEDREFFAELYNNMAKNKGFNMSRDINIWMYGKEIVEMDDNQTDGKYPWEY